MSVIPAREGYHSITPQVNIKDCEKAIEFYKNVFGAEERIRHPSQGTIIHCELKIGDSLFTLSEAVTVPPYHMHVMLYVHDCDAVFKRAVDAGAIVKHPPTDQWYGDRIARISDPFGNHWAIATTKEQMAT